MRTDDVHRRESAGIGQVFLKVARVTGAACSGNSVDESMCTPLFFHPLLTVAKTSDSLVLE